MRLWFRQIAFIVLLGSCGVPTAESQSGGREIEDRIVDPKLCPTGPLKSDEARLCALLNNQAVAKAKDLIGSGVARLIVTSPGGGEDYAIQISELAEAAGVQLVFEKFCLSSCAHFLFLPAKGPEVKDGTLIAFHHTTLAFAALRARTDVPDRERFANAALRAVNRQVAFFESRGIATEWLVEPLMRMGPTCIAKEVDWTNPDYPYVAFKAEHRYWIPSRQMLEARGGGPFVGFWPESVEEAQALLDGVGQELSIGKVIWKGPVRFTPFNDLDKLPFCE